MRRRLQDRGMGAFLRRVCRVRPKCAKYRAYGRYFVHTWVVNLARPFQSLSPARDMEILRELALSDAPRTGRRVAADAGVAHSTALRILDRLEAEGIVHSEAAGAARVFRLNDEHILVPVIREIALTRTRLIERFRSEIADWSDQPLLAVIFGSFARGEAGIDSDIDVLVVPPKRVPDRDSWDAQIETLENHGRAWAGNAVNIVDIDRASLGAEREVLADVRANLIELTDGARDRLGEIR